MTLNTRITNSDYSTCPQIHLDFDDRSMEPEVWYETTTDGSTPANYVDLIWDPCDIDVEAQSTRTSYLYTNSIGGLLYQTGGDPTPAECEQELRDDPAPLDWFLDPWHPESADIEVGATICLKTNDDLLVLATFDSISPENTNDWMAAHLTVTTYSSTGGQL